MSQTPDYYTPGPPRTPQPRSYANRASIMLFVLGALGILLSTCAGAAIWMMPIDSIVQNSGLKMPEPPPGISLEQLIRATTTVLCILGIFFSGALGILGMFVRRGGKIAGIFSSILCSLAILFFCFEALADLVYGALSGNAVLIVQAVMILVPVALFAVTLIWLVQFLRALSATRQAQYQSQYGQMQQQQPSYPFPPNTSYPPIAPLSPPTGYGAAPAPRPADQPPVRHPPLPPDQKTPDAPE